jgi:ABC-type Fe3+/spermidine/putrescine transport system ATPase subunit
LKVSNVQNHNVPILDVRDIIKTYDGAPALRGVSLSAAAGTIVCLLGPSGCGKSTLLRVIAGLERADHGQVQFDGRPIDAVPTHQRGFGLMFQDYALFPHRDVAGNVAFGLRMQNLPRPQIEAQVAAMLELVGLTGYERRRVYELSGGEQQRVALARSLAPSPRLLMLDEPLGALDRALRERLLDDLRAILKRVGVTSIYVTHDQAEAFAIADWLVLLDSGQIAQQGPPEQVYRHPNSVFVARFMGHTNLVAGCVVDLQEKNVIVETTIGRLASAEPSPNASLDTQVVLAIRPEAALPAQIGAPESLNRIQGTVAERSFRGSRTRLTVQHTSGLALEFELDDADLPALGEPIVLALRAEAISVVSSEPSTRLRPSF